MTRSSDAPGGEIERSPGDVPERVAAIDIGTNSVLLLIADATTLEPIVERATITRLGQGVDHSGVPSDEAVERTLRCLADYAASIHAHGVARLDVVGTSAMRDARGGEGFVESTRQLLGVRPRVISGDEEAALTFEGALSGIEGLGDREVVVFDIGGGSTEIIVGLPSATGRPTLERAQSLDVGSVRLFERHVRGDPPAPAELDQVRGDVRRALSKLGFSAPAGAPLVGVAGTLTTLAAVSLSLSPYDGSRVHGSRLAREELSRLATLLAGLPLDARRQLPGLEPKRADVIVAGVVLALEVLDWARATELIVSDRGVRWGLAQRLAGPGPTHVRGHRVK